MNSHGISIGLTGRFYKGKRASKLTMTNAIELKILRYAKNFDDIRNIYNTKTGFDRTDGLLISSQEDGDYKLFEVAPIGAAVTPSANGILFTTNSYIHPTFHKNNKQWGNIFNNRFCDPRHKRMMTLMADKPDTIDDAFKILKDRTQPDFENRTFFGQATINRFITHVSALMVRGKNPGIWIARAHTYAASNEFVFFDFSSQPQHTVKKKEADETINMESFKNFKNFINLRESRYFLTPKKLLLDARKLVVKEPENPVFVLFLAQNYFKYGKFEQAVDVLETYPHDWLADYWYCLGKCKQELRQYEVAKECFLKAIKVFSVDGFNELVELVCLVQLIKLTEKLGHLEEAQHFKERLQTMKAGFPTPHIGMPDYPYINNIVEQLEQVII